MGTPENQATDALVISWDDHDIGYKEIEVTFSSGKTRTVRLRALDRRRLFKIAQNPNFSDADKQLAIMELSVPDECNEDFFRAIDAASLRSLIQVACLLAFPAEKKIQPVETPTTATVAAAPSSS